MKSFVTILIVTMCCKSYGQDTASNPITFLQGGRSIIITKHSDSVLLKRKPFSLRYFANQYDDINKKFYAAQIAVLVNPNDTAQLKLGQSIDSIPYFKPGTGMAGGVNTMYDKLIITNEGHHYLMYQDEDNKRVNLVSRTGNKLELEWKISEAFYQEESVPFSELKLSSFYFIIFIDNNLNEIIDQGELKIVKVVFK